MKNLHTSWKYPVEHINEIAPGELFIRETLYRMGASAFQETAIVELSKKLEGEYGAEEIIDIIKNLKP